MVRMSEARREMKDTVVGSDEFLYISRPDGRSRYILKSGTYLSLADAFAAVTLSK